MKISQQGCIEPRSDLPYKFELFALVNAHQKRAEMLSRAAWSCVAADYEFLLALEFQLDPGAAATARFVCRILALANESFQPNFPRLTKKFFSVLAQRSRKPMTPDAFFKSFWSVAFRSMRNARGSAAVGAGGSVCRTFAGALGQARMPEATETKIDPFHRARQFPHR